MRLLHKVKGREPKNTHAKREKHTLCVYYTHHRHTAGFYAHCDYFIACCNNVIFVLSFLVSLWFETVLRDLVTSALRVYRAHFPLKYLVYRQEILPFLCSIVRLLCFPHAVYSYIRSTEHLVTRIVTF